MIKPTVGRVVWFIPKESSHSFGFSVNAGKEHAAVVAYVHSDTCVNLSVIDANGNHFCRTSVQLVQEGEKVPEWDHCRWMPYQIGQAKAQQAEQVKVAA